MKKQGGRVGREVGWVGGLSGRTKFWSEEEHVDVKKKQDRCRVEDGKGRGEGREWWRRNKCSER